MQEMSFRLLLVTGWLVLFPLNPAANAADQCPPLERCESADGTIDRSANCRCPAGSKKTPFMIQGLDMSWEIVRCEDRTIRINVYSCDGPAPAPAKPEVTTTKCPVRSELLANLKWIHDDAAHNKKSAVMQGNILRASTFLDAGGVPEIMKAYKLAQSHNPRVAGLIDKCNDLTIDGVAYEFAETYVRLRSCGGTRPAVSATCSDYSENLRWALLNSGPCAPFARAELDGLDGVSTVREKAYFIRRGFKYAQGHARDTALSVDFISDTLLVQLIRNPRETDSYLIPKSARL